jgi:uroporphyrinogen decarboxylase
VRERLAQTQTPTVPFILFAKGANYALEELSRSAGWDVLGLDWLINPDVAREMAGERVALQGNVDPSVLYAGRDAIEQEVMRVAKAFSVKGRSKGHIFNLGHGITPGVDPEDFKWFLECVHRYTKPNHN